MLVCWEKEGADIHDYGELLVDPHFVRMKESSDEDFAYAMTPLKIMSWPVGTWPLQVYDILSAIRAIIAILLLV